MEVIPQTPNASPYFTAPASPSGFSLNSILYYSAPTSPTKRVENALSHHGFASFKTSSTSSNPDDFEFGTSKRFGDSMELEMSQNFDCLIDGRHEEEKLKQHQRGGSLPTMAFADELFSNGQIMPLKLPPRLQHGNDRKNVSQGSIASSPRSPISVCKVSFARWIMWSNDFDPFKVALQKVTEEKRGMRRCNGSHHHIHKRTRSHSPFRTTILEWSTEDAHLKPVQNSALNTAEHVEFKGSSYARWVRDQTNYIEPSPKQSTKRSFFGEIVRSRKIEHKETNKNSSTCEVVEGNGRNVTMETKMKRIKGLVLRYASFGKENNDSKARIRIFAFWKSSYFRRLSFKLKGSC